VKIAANGSKDTQQGLVPSFCRTPRQKILDALCREIFSNFGRNRSFSTEYALIADIVLGAALFSKNSKPQLDAMFTNGRYGHSLWLSGLIVRFQAGNRVVRTGGGPAICVTVYATRHPSVS
jgi:hypothetical protein